MYFSPAANDDDQNRGEGIVFFSRSGVAFLFIRTIDERDVRECRRSRYRRREDGEDPPVITDSIVSRNRRVCAALMKSTCSDARAVLSYAVTIASHSHQ